MDDDTIQIPITEYENFRNCVMYQDKQPLIRELQQLLQDKEEDLQRYKEKLEQCDSVLTRTQRQLDNCMQFNKVDRPITLLVPRSISVPVNSRGPVKSRGESTEVVSRAAGDGTRDATEHDETSSMPTSRVPDCESDHLRSVPLGLGMTGFAPGMSTALLQKLVAENLRLRKQLQSLNNGKPLKLSNDSQVQDLKFQLSKKQDQLDELRKQLSVIPLDPSSSQTVDSWLLQKVEKLEKTLDMNKVVIKSLTEQKDCIAREKASMESLLEEYRTYDRQAENKYNEEKITELEAELESRKKDHDKTSTKLESVQVELESLRHRLDVVERERDLIAQNYETICTEFQNLRCSSAYPSHPTPISAGAFKPAASALSSSALSSFTDSALASSMYQSQYSQPPGIARHRVPAEPPLPPRMQPQHRNSGSTNTHTAPTTPQPPPRDRRILKCPRCEAVFHLLQSYRDHINICLKSST